MEKKIKVLFVDDDDSIRALYVEALQAVNFDVSSGKDGLDALEQINKDTPDIIVTGIIMPRMDGFQFIEALKKNVTMSDIPVMIFSHLGREEDKTRATELGVQDFLVRDMTTPNDLIERINEHFLFKNYVLGIDAFGFDAAIFAKDFDINPDFVCSEEKAGGRIALTLRKNKKGAKSFDAEITCV